MSLSTISKFYYGWVIDTTNNNIDFQEAGAALLATLNTGSYTLTDFITEISRAMNAAGTYTYTVSVNRTTRIITIVAGSTFKLLTSTGTHGGTTAFTLMGYTGSDKTGATSYAAGTATGSQYTPQFRLQSYVSPSDWKESIQPTVNESASGTIEVIRFGTRQFLQFDIQFATNIPQRSNGWLTSNLTGVANLESFMDYMMTKGPMEFMPDKDSPSTFYKVLCEKTPDSGTGTGYMLQEMYDKGMPGYFNTGIIKMRVVS